MSCNSKASSLSSSPLSLSSLWSFYHFLLMAPVFRRANNKLASWQKHCLMSWASSLFDPLDGVRGPELPQGKSETMSTYFPISLNAFYCNLARNDNLVKSRIANCIIAVCCRCTLHLKEEMSSSQEIWAFIHQMIAKKVLTGVQICY